jgi:alkylation response protein AidB-like acyl-CoA dehydrogenase
MDTMTITPIPGPTMLDAARDLGPQLAEHAARHDHDGTFVEEGFEILRRSGYLAAPVPVDLGGGGATTEQVAWAQAELARYCASTALATTMHLHVVLANAWRWRKGQPGAEGMLRKVADEGVLVASTGGGDFTAPTGEARPTDGGWLVTGRKSFVSGAPAMQLASTWATTTDGEAIGFGVALDNPAVTIVENWDAPGMRGTASFDVVFDDLFVPETSVTARRTPNEFAPVLAILAAKALPVIAATYLGVANGARDEVVARLRDTARADDPGVRRTIGAIDEHLLSARFALEGAFRMFGEDPEPTPATLSAGAMVKKVVIDHARAAGDLAMDVLGGRAYRHGDVVERAWRDLRAGPFHPLEAELTLRVAGDVALGRPVDLA